MDNLRDRIKWHVFAFVLYYFLASLSILLTRDSHSIALIWYPNVVYGLLLTTQPVKNWGSLSITLVLANLFANLPHSFSFIQTMAYLPSNIIEVMLVAYLCKYHCNITKALESRHEFLKVIIYVCFIPPTIGAIVSSFVFSLMGQFSIPSLWFHWTISSMLGSVSILPISLCLMAFDRKKILELSLTPTSLLYFAISIIVTYAASRYSTEPFVIVLILLILVASKSFFRLSFTIFNLSLLIPVLIYFEQFPYSKSNDLVYLYGYLLMIILCSLLYSITLRKARIDNRTLESVSFKATQLYEKTPAAMHSINNQGVIVAVSDKWLELFGYRRDEVIGKKSIDFLTTASAEIATHESLPQFFKTGRADKVNYEMVRSDNRTLDIELSAVLIKDESESRAYSVLYDVSKEKILTKQLYEEKELLEITLQSMGDGMIATDEHGDITYLNPVAELLTGVMFADAKGKPFEDIVHLYADSSGKSLYNPAELAIENNCRMGIPETAYLKSTTGDKFLIQDSVSPIIDKQGNVRGAVMVFQDVTETRAISERMSYLAQHDMLTDLPNRVLLMDRLTIACANYNRHKIGFSLLFLDLDNFKTINDSLGHSFGDDVLKCIAKRIKSVTRETDTVSRIGGDEFVIILEGDLNLVQLSKWCTEFLVSIATPIIVRDREFRITGSVGVSSCPRDAKDPETLLRRADVAMYRAKNLGRNAYSLYSRKLEIELNERLHLEQKLRYAVEHKEIVFFYQPIVEASNQRVVYAEGLCRWISSDGVMTPPNKFIPIAEETQIIVDIGYMLLRQACQSMSLLSGVFGKLSINISAVQLSKPNFVENSISIMREEGVKPDKFIFEITETSLMLNPDESLKVLSRLKKFGILIAIDDFGTGYSSLSYLKHFPVDILKIDKAFVDDIEFNHQDRTFIEAIIKMARTLDILVVAEGVETREQADALFEMGCNFLQGYYFSKPKPLEQVIESNDSLENVVAINRKQ
ncbi:EAL domain-containing protein [Vibrio sp. VB16]|uniref:EAL domain-containing protein n=1 Tax=Vibrio sp. VB16 TaxID=2785746 RepID=UPI00189D0638|nr:EAL domain-containing protein [Vibrio sp. VB16]UGA55746.1 EAL domain-containing protein [Vibrio sp. VB16]